MTQNVTQWFTERFETAVHRQFQQTKARLGDTVAGGGTFDGDKVYFPRIDAVKSYKSPAFARLALANANQDMIELTADPEFVAFGLWDPHKKKYSVNTADEYGVQAASAIARAEDDCIIAALQKAATDGVKKIGEAGFEQIVTIGDYDTVATLNDVAEALAVLGTNEVPDTEQITVTMPFRNKVQFALDPYMNADKKANQVWDDVTWRRTERLPLSNDAGGVDLFVYAKSALVSAYNDQLTKIDERDGPALTDIIGYWLQVGAMARNARGIVRIKSKKNFDLYRQPVDTREAA